MKTLKTITMLFVTALLGATVPALAQTKDPSVFHGAEATKAHYKAAYQLDSEEPDKIKGTLRNIQNALDDPRLKGKLDLELVVHGPGVAAFRKDSGYEEMVKKLQDRGVTLSMCENTMRERKISKDELFPFLSYVPSGNGELIIRGQEGWTIIHP
ncbi:MULTISPECIES: DsrE family protein [Spirosoma]|uniref:Uncharacterized protein n=1 Tax=Spirosoma pollinicola TaxID=2057025 RepID=A0A2K8ZCC7_9BACT|nr:MULTISPECIES: DsrE family protein [Spirosoma]AUD07525.1 hypothetical protein CWM47_28365 [Spirosoma pollinicola]RYF76001.1 MAG: hypothetical protein EOO39_06155 [Cytophagaceae bacterium]